MAFEQIISDIITEVSYRSKEGIVNFKNPEHISILSEVLDEMGLDVIKNELFQNLFEAEKNPEDEKYKNTGGSGYVKADDYERWRNNPDGFDGPRFRKTDSGDYVQVDKDGNEVEKDDKQQDSTFWDYVNGDTTSDTTVDTQNIINSFSNEKDSILAGEVSPPGTGGSAIGEMYGGTAIQDSDLGEDEFIQKHFEDVKNSDVSKGMTDKDIRVWLTVAYKTGQSEIKELKTNPKYRYKIPQTSPYPVPVMDPVNTKGSARGKLLSFFQQKLKEAVEAGNTKAVTHYKRQLFFINKRQDTDTGVLYETNDGYIGFKHTSNKKSFNDPVFNTTVNQRGEVMKSSVSSVSNEYDINEQQSKVIENNIDSTIQKAVTSIEEAGLGPSGAVKNNISDTREFSSKHKLGNQFKNFSAGAKGRYNYLDDIKAEMESNKGLGKKVNGVLQELGIQPPYSDDDVAGAVLELSKRGDTTTNVNKMVVKLSDNVKLAREVYDRLRKQNSDLSDDEVREKTLETLNGYKTDNGVPFDRESLDTLLSPELDWIERVGAQTRDAMGSAHEQIVTDLTDADEKWQRENSPSQPQPPVNGPHAQAYIESYMKQMHWDRYILGDEEDIGDMNIAGKTVNSTMIRGCLADLSGYVGDLDSKEGRAALMSHLRKTMKISSESQSLTFNSGDGTTPIEIGRESYRTKGVGNNSLLGNFGTDLQKCLKSK